MSFNGAGERSADAAVAILMTASMSSLEGMPSGGSGEQGIRSCNDMGEKRQGEQVGVVSNINTQAGHLQRAESSQPC